MNEYMIPKYHIEVELLPMQASEYAQKVQLMISGGDVKAVQGTTLVQAAPVEAEPTISVSALVELLKDADPSVKAQLRLALLT